MRVSMIENNNIMEEISSEIVVHPACTSGLVKYTTTTYRLYKSERTPVDTASMLARRSGADVVVTSACSPRPIASWMEDRRRILPSKYGAGMTCVGNPGP